LPLVPGHLSAAVLGARRRIPPTASGGRTAAWCRRDYATGGRRYICRHLVAAQGDDVCPRRTTVSGTSVINALAFCRVFGEPSLSQYSGSVGAIRFRSHAVPTRSDKVAKEKANGAFVTTVLTNRKALTVTECLGVSSTGPVSQPFMNAAPQMQFIWSVTLRRVERARANLRAKNHCWASRDRQSSDVSRSAGAGRRQHARRSGCHHGCHGAYV
jgi:hypothetical protein